MARFITSLTVNNFDALENWHNVRLLACIMLQSYTGITAAQKEKGMKMTWKKLWIDLYAILTINTIEEVIAEIDI